MESVARPGEVDLSPDCEFDRFLARLPEGLDSLLRLPDAMIARRHINMNGSLRSDDCSVPRWGTLDDALGGCAVELHLDENKSWLKQLEESEMRQLKAIALLESRRKPSLEPVRFMGGAPAQNDVPRSNHPEPSRSAVPLHSQHRLLHRRPQPDPAALAAARAQAQKEAEMMKRKKDAELACFQEQQKKMQELRRARAIAARPVLSQAHVKASAQPLGRKAASKMASLTAQPAIKKKSLIRPGIKVPFTGTTEQTLSVESIFRQVRNLSRLPAPVTPLAARPPRVQQRGAKRARNDEETAVQLAPAKKSKKISEEKLRNGKVNRPQLPLASHAQQAGQPVMPVHRLAQASGPLKATTATHPRSSLPFKKDAGIPTINMSSMNGVKKVPSLNMRIKLVSQHQHHQAAAAR